MTRIPARLAPLALLLLAAPFTTGAEGGCGSLSVEDLEDSQVTYTEIASFSGTILEFGSGDPIEGASVRVADKRATSDDIGFFYIANIQAGEHALSLSAGGYLPRTETIELLAGANALDPIYLVPSGGAGGSGGWAGEGGSGGSIGGAGGSGGGAGGTSGIQRRSSSTAARPGAVTRTVPLAAPASSWISAPSRLAGPSRTVAPSMQSSASGVAHGGSSTPPERAAVTGPASMSAPDHTHEVAGIE